MESEDTEYMDAFALDVVTGCITMADAERQMAESLGAPVDEREWRIALAVARDVMREVDRCER